MTKKDITTKVALEELMNDPKYQEADRKFRENKKQERERRFKPQGIINYYLPGETVRLV